MIGAIQDLTNYKRLLDEQINLSNELSQSNKDLQQFGYIVSHNLRGSIASIKGLVSILDIDKYQFPDEIKILLNHLRRVAENLDVTISDLVHILQIRSNNDELKQVLYFKDIIEDVFNTLSEEIINSKAKIHTNFEEALVYLL